MGGSVADSLTALFASVDYDISAARIGLCSYRHKKSAAGVGSVTGIYVNVQGMQAEGAVISRGVAEGQYLAPAVSAYEAVVVFCKSFTFHSLSVPFVRCCIFCPFSCIILPESVNNTNEENNRTVEE